MTGSYRLLNCSLINHTHVSYAHPERKYRRELLPLSLSLPSFFFRGVRLPLKLEQTERHPFYRLLPFGLTKEVKIIVYKSLP